MKNYVRLIAVETGGPLLAAVVHRTGDPWLKANVNKRFLKRAKVGDVFVSTGEIIMRVGKVFSS